MRTETKTMLDKFYEVENGVVQNILRQTEKLATIEEIVDSVGATLESVASELAMGSALGGVDKRAMLRTAMTLQLLHAPFIKLLAGADTARDDVQLFKHQMRNALESLVEMRRKKADDDGMMDFAIKLADMIVGDVADDGEFCEVCQTVHGMPHGQA